MGLYWKKCPHCWRTIEHGYGGNRTQTFGDPKKRCKYCGKIYIDRDVIDWPNASLVRKLIYCFANGRIALCIFPYILTAMLTSTKLNWNHPFLYCFPVFLLMFALCVVYVKFQVKHFYRNASSKINLVEKKRQKVALEDEYAQYNAGLFDPRPRVKKGAVEAALKKAETKPRTEKRKISTKDILKRILNFISSHIKLSIILTATCVALMVASIIGYNVSDTSMFNAREHYDETFNRISYQHYSVGCGLETCVFCEGTVHDYYQNYSPYLFEYYNTVSDECAWFELCSVIFSVLSLLCVTTLIIGITYRYKFTISIKERKN